MLWVLVASVKGMRHCCHPHSTFDTLISSNPFQEPAYLSETMLRDLFDQTLAKHYLMDGVGNVGRGRSTLRSLVGGANNDASAAYIDPMMPLDIGDVDNTVDDMPHRLASLLQQQQQQHQLKNLQAEQLDYDSLLAARGLNARPSLRDQEYAHQSTLWGHRFGSGGGVVRTPGRHQQQPYGDDDYVAEDPTAQRQQPSESDIIVAAKNSPSVNLKTGQIRSDLLPAYCNPPNPCPVGYTADSGCLGDFENTAAFSRDYQAAQECMCDNEHMFVCQQDSDKRPQQGGDEEHGEYLKRQYGPAQEHKNLVAKKFHPSSSSASAGRLNTNPYLEGEKLPVAAKKGIRAY